MHYAAALGHSKPDARFYRLVEAEARLDPRAIFFIDDRMENVAGARDCGWTAALWTGQESLGDLILQQEWSVR
jgi:putative hydrolase of the HAD superfamily